MDPITITIMVIQGFIAVASTTWAISQSLSKNSFTKKMDQLTSSVAKILDLLHQTRQKYVTKEEFDRRSQQVDKRETQQTQRFLQKYNQLYQKCDDINGKLDQHILQWAKQKH